jgi:hypothetical protein
MPRGALHQGGACGPWRDVQHVGAVDGVELFFFPFCSSSFSKRGTLRWPLRRHHIEEERWAEIGECGFCDAGCEGGERAGVCVGGLPGPLGHGGGESGGVLACAGGDFQYRAAFAEHATH